MSKFVDKSNTNEKVTVTLIKGMPRPLSNKQQSTDRTKTNERTK